MPRAMPTGKMSNASAALSSFLSPKLSNPLYRRSCRILESHIKKDLHVAGCPPLSLLARLHYPPHTGANEPVLQLVPGLAVEPNDGEIAANASAKQ